MQPKRILICSYFDRKKLFGRYYSLPFKLMNGFIRAGHNVIPFSDRDHARESTIWATQKRGRKRMAKKLLELCETYRPHLVVFAHSDLLEDDTFISLREKVPGVRLADCSVDAIFRQQTMAYFVRRSIHMDACFITTGDRHRLRALGLPQGRTYFIPNPVDASIETAQVFDVPATQLSYDGQFLGTGIGKREEQLTFLKKTLPSGYRFNTGGRAFNAKWQTSTSFLNALTQAAVSPNLPLDDTDSESMVYLYSSDRVGQLLGQGVTTISPAKAGLSDLYEDGIVEYDSREHLASLMEELYGDDAKRRKIGETGHRIAHERTNERIVAEFIFDATFGNNLDRFSWPSKSA
ncbi:glycosyltransferase [uncultured Martelella sp.]|uniref:glycosyltransferase n=1 Tax=uncultured Martelella sp. TaxID=392331 RepID=UPI0029C84AE5|nr:glycosyltransferase [uncultured Martelella sp.]